MNEGISSYNTSNLMPAFVNFEVPRRSLWTNPWTQAHIFTGTTQLHHNTTTIFGLGFNPGRFGVSQMVDENKYDGGSVTYEAAVLLAHELGHNYDSEHTTSATTTSHCHGTLCSGGRFTHYTIMHNGWMHEPGNDRTEMTGWISTSTTDIDDCIEDTSSAGWHSLPYTINWSPPANGCSP